MSLLFPIKNYLLSRKNRKLRPSVVQHKTIPYSQAQHFGILLQVNESQDTKSIEPLLKQLQKDDKKVEVILFQPTKSKTEIRASYRHFLVHQEQIDWDGNIDVVAVQKFISTRFDYIFCISQQNIALFERILLLSQAKCRVGIHIVGKEWLYEWMVFAEERESIATIAKRMIDTVSTLQE